MSSLNAFEAPPHSSRVPTRLLPRTLHVPSAAPVSVPSLSAAVSVAPLVTNSAKVQEVMRLSPRIPAPSTVRPTSPRTGMMAIVGPTPVTTPTKAPPPRRGLPGRVLVALLLMALAAGGVFLYQRVRPSGPPHPANWDPSVLPVVRAVERDRGLAFEHPVFVDLLSDSDYSARVATDTAPADRAQAADRRDMANALGFANTYDSSTSDTVLSADSSRGTYSTTSDRILIRGTELTPGVSVVLAHELTHALQAQHFD
ncbi:MAG: hypothetical protein WCI22_17395, partial [Actinomycetota bacterium]